MQSAITIGGGSLSNSLYLGVPVGFSCMWVQPLAMIPGVVMLSAIAVLTSALSFWSLWSQGGKLGSTLGMSATTGNYLGLGIFMGFGILVLVVHFTRKRGKQ